MLRCVKTGAMPPGGRGVGCNFHHYHFVLCAHLAATSNEVLAKCSRAQRVLSTRAIPRGRCSGKSVEQSLSMKRPAWSLGSNALASRPASRRAANARGANRTRRSGRMLSTLRTGYVTRARASSGRCVRSAAELAKRGHVNNAGRPFVAMFIRNMVRRAPRLTFADPLIRA